MTNTWFDPNDPMGGAAPGNEELAAQRAKAAALRAQSGQQQQQQGGMQLDPQAMKNIYEKFAGAGATVGGSAAPTAGSMSGVGAAANSSAVTSGAGGLSAGPNAAWMSSLTGGGGAGAGSAAGGGATSASALGSYAAAIPVFKKFVEWGEDADLGVADQYDFYREKLGDLGNKFGIKNVSETLKFWK